MQKVVPSITDQEHLKFIRANVVSFMKRVASQYTTSEGVLLDIAPQDHEGARPFFPDMIKVKTFDINPHSGCDYIGDICKRNDFLEDGSFDYIVCTEVLEHVLYPFDAVDEIFRLLKRGGYVFLTVPFNFRIHGPLPDCWRFTIHGLKVLFARFSILELGENETQGRPLMPIQYTLIAQKPNI
jgi:SAM-dependent methyltransferase